MPATVKQMPLTNALPNIFDRAVCLSVQMGCLGASKKVSASLVEVDADKTLIAVSKRLFSSKEYDAIKQAQSAIRAYLYNRSVPAAMLRGGFYMVNRPIMQEIDSDLEAFQAQIKDLTEELLKVYDRIKDTDRERLRSAFNDRDYPSAQKVRDSIFLEWGWISFGVAEDIPDNIRQKEEAKAAAKVQQAAETIQQLLRAEMSELVDHMVGKLTGEREGGKPKIFRDSLVTNIRDFLKFFSDRNITDDAELERLTKQADQLLKGVDPQMLRDDDTLRKKIADGFVQVKAELDTMVVDKPIRQIKLDSEE